MAIAHRLICNDCKCRQLYWPHRCAHTRQFGWNLVIMTIPVILSQVPGYVLSQETRDWRDYSPPEQRPPPPPHHHGPHAEVQRGQCHYPPPFSRPWPGSHAENGEITSHNIQRWSGWKKNNPADLIIDCAWKCGCGAQHINFHLVLYIDDQFMISFSYKCSPNSSINHKHLAGTFCQSFYQMRSGLRWSKYVT